MELPRTTEKRQSPARPCPNVSAVPTTLSNPKVASIWRILMVL